MASKSLPEVCTSRAPCKTASLHIDAVVKTREATGDSWPRYFCPNCGFSVLLPEWNTENARAVVGQL